MERLDQRGCGGEGYPLLFVVGMAAIAMKLAIFGATGALGSECLKQAVEAGHDVTVLVRNQERLSSSSEGSMTIIQGDALELESVKKVIADDTEAVLFCIGVGKNSQPDLCTSVTKHILSTLKPHQRFVWCGGGSQLVPEDQVTFGAKFVKWYAQSFMSLKHEDKEHQLEYLLEHTADTKWLGIRPLQMVKGPKTETYRLGYDKFSGMSKISFADCAHAMLQMLAEDTWIHKVPIVQY